MSTLGIGSTIGQLNQWSDENITVKKDAGNFKTLDAAKKAASELSKSDTEDAVIVENDDKTFQVLGVDEVGTLDPSGNISKNRYDIHDTSPNVVSFFVSKRDEKGARIEKSGEKEVVIKNTSLEKLAADAVKHVSNDINPMESNKFNWGVGWISANATGIRGVRNESGGSGLKNDVDFIMKVAYESEKAGYGNCREHACLTARHLMMNNAPNVEIFGKENHAFVVIGRDPNSDDINPATWGSNAMVVDSWSNESYPATPENLQKHMGIAKEDWSAGKTPELWQEARITDSEGKIVKSK